MKHNFRKLTIYQNSIQIAKEVYLFTDQLPGEEKFNLQSQMRRAATSIPLNIAEGCGYNSHPMLNKHLGIALGSCYELETSLLLCKEIFECENENLQSCLKQLTYSIGKFRTTIKS